MFYASYIYIYRVVVFGVISYTLGFPYLALLFGSIW